MGTLFHQEPRNYRSVQESELKAFLEYAVALSKHFKISVSDVIEAKKVLELQRQNTIYVENGDTFDEQLAGFGKILQDIADTLKKS